MLNKPCMKKLLQKTIFNLYFFLNPLSYPNSKYTLTNYFNYQEISTNHSQIS